MSNTDQDQESRSEEALRELFRHGSRRLQPPVEDEQEIREAVYAEWNELTGKRRRNRRLVYWAAAASVVFATVFAWNSIRVPAFSTTAATVQRSLGDVYVREQGTGNLTAAKDLDFEMLVGQTIVTKTGSAVAIAWSSGGSLRLDQQTDVLIVSPTEVELVSGRVYYDSGMLDASGLRSSSLTVTTAFGTVRHIGTQFMADVSDDVLTVSVREGLVSVDGVRFAGETKAGQKIEIHSDGDHTLDSDAGFGANWRWVESIVPALNLDGRSVLEFLNWVSRESGRPLKFESSSAEVLAASTNLQGRVEVEPTRALRIFLQTTDLKSEIVDDVISIRLAAAGE